MGFLIFNMKQATNFNNAIHFKEAKLEMYSILDSQIFDISNRECIFIH
jgi:hypothetical protein